MSLSRPSEAEPMLRRVDAWLFSDYLRAEQRSLGLQSPNLSHQDLWLNGSDGRRPRGPANLSGPDQELFQGILNQDVSRARTALAAGADPNASWSDLTWMVRDRVVPLTPLGVALWMGYEHSDHLPRSALRDEDGQVVDALLTAGAEPDPNVLRRFVQDGEHPAFEHLERAVLDRLAQGRPLPSTLWTAQDRDQWAQAHPEEPETSVLPMTVMHAPQLWLHRAVEQGNAVAVEQWFALDGVVGTGGSASALEDLWDQRLTRLGNGKEGYPDWVRMLAAVRNALLAEPSAAVFRKEVMNTLGTYATQLDRFLPTDPVMTACRDWTKDLLRDRPLTLYQVMEPEIWAMEMNEQQTARVSEVLRELENDHLRTVITTAMPPDEDSCARPRPRL